MSDRTPDQAMQFAIQHHQAGRLPEAEAIYRRVLARQPDHAGALHLLGLAAHQVGRHEMAVELIGKAIAIAPAVAAFHASSGEALRCLGRLDEAIAAQSRAIQLKPDLAEAHCNLGNALQSQGKFEQAVAAYSRAIRLKPGYADAYGNLGAALRNAGKLDAAAAACAAAIKLKPEVAEPYSNLGNVLAAQGWHDEAAAAYSRAIQLKPQYAEAHYNLGQVLEAQGRIDEAIAAYSASIGIKPDFADAHNNLGNALKTQGLLDAALESYARAMALRPADARLGSNRIFCIVYHPAYDSAAILREEVLWNNRHGKSPQYEAGFRNDVRRTAGTTPRRLRIGYISPFSDDAVGRNVLPLFREHDHQKFEIFCYDAGTRSDEFTKLIRSHAHAWRTVSRLNDAAVVRQIRDDGIDILVDLALHSAGNRLPVLARRPAPVQATFAGYPGGTGVNAIDYRLTDPYLDPPGVSDADYVEKSIRLPESFWCYDPAAMMLGLSQTPQVGPLPATGNGHITFGCLNNFCKVNPPMLTVWASVMRIVPRSRLILLSPQGGHRQRTVDLMSQEGIDADRIEFLPRRSREQYLASYRGIDIGLDTVPYNGHTTSLDSYWMGVPVVTMVGRTVVGRAGLSQLTNLGLTELVARDGGQFVRIAGELAADLPRLAELRASLRMRMLKSPLTDAKRFARNIEAAYEQVWG